MAQDPKKPEEKPAEKTEIIPPEQQTYPTPELDLKTGAPVDTRFQSDNSQEVTTAQQLPKSEAKAKEKENGDDEEDDDDDDETSKGKGKPRSRR